jgi:uncharacterized protein (DUF1778 family)
MQQKVQHVHIRASEREKAMLARAASSKRISISQFVLQAALPLAESILAAEAGDVDTLFQLDAAAWEAFVRLLDEPARDIPELRELLESKAPWER